MKTFDKYLIFFIAFYFLLSIGVKGQAVVIQGTDIGLTPQEFVETYLVGSGITVTNALYNGSALPLNSPLREPLKARDQIGSFTCTGGAQTELGINGGVLLSTGFAGKAVAGNSIPGSDDMWGNFIPPTLESDPDLVILAGSNINDKSVLEFDFTPQTDVVTFRYVFGSREFDQFCSGSYNDAFGLFLSGPGIAGGLGFVNDAVNIALLPNSANYVNIHNICAVDQGNTGNGVYSWWNLKKDFYTYNRITYVFTASYPVDCFVTYHMKFAIGDAGDASYDSGVFLEENSFTSNVVASNTSFSNPLTGQMLVEGCNNVTLVYSITQPKDVDLDIDLFIHSSGSATQADITPNPFPIKATIPAFQLQSAPIQISAIMDAPEGSETLVIKGTPPIVCGNDNSVLNEFVIADHDPMTILLQNATICDGSSVVLAPVITGGQPILPGNAFYYLWSSGETTSSILVSPPPGHHTYSVTVTEACDDIAAATVTVDVGTTPGPADPVTGVSVICTPATGLTYSIPPIPGAESYLWTVPPGSIITAGENTNSITVNFSTAASSGPISVYGHSTYCGDGAASALPLTINPSPEPAGPITGISIVCQGPSLHTYSIAPLSYVTTYEWSTPAGVSVISGTGTNSIECLFPPGAVSGNFTVRGFNPECGYGSPASLAITVNPLPGNAEPISSAGGAVVCQQQNGVIYSIPVIPFATEYLWEYTGSGVTLTNNGPDISLDFSAVATSGTLTVRGHNGCGDGIISPPFMITVRLKPTAVFTSCHAVQTTKNGRPILLKGGSPLGDGGVYTGPGVTMAGSGTWVFDPSDNAIIGGTAAIGIPSQVTFRYTNAEGCSDEKSLPITVFASNANDPCPGTMKDHRDGKIYPVFASGTGLNTRCWTAANLNFGTSIMGNSVPADNCVWEKYCPGNTESNCEVSGGFYPWDEILEYQESNTYQDICPPGWHIPTPSEWELLIDANQGNALAGSYLKDLQVPDGFAGELHGVWYLNSVWAYTSGQTTGSMYWTSSGLPGKRALAHGLNQQNPSVSWYEASRANAFSVRCVRN